MMKHFIGKNRKNEQIKGLISNMWLIICYMTQLVIPNVVPNLIILSQVVAEKSLTEDVHMHYIGVRDGKIENLKKKEK